MALKMFDWTQALHITASDRALLPLLLGHFLDQHCQSSDESGLFAGPWPPPMVTHATEA